MDIMRITDVWFRTELSLKEISDNIGAKFDYWDGESYWEWVISDFENIRIDITRKDTEVPMQYDTRIFVCGQTEFPDEALLKLTARLQALNISPINLGQWRYIDGNEFEQVVDRVIR